MAKVCEICNRNKKTGFNVSHSNKKTKREWRSNIQKVRVALDNNQVKRINVCTRCIRSGKIKRAI